MWEGWGGKGQLLEYCGLGPLKNNHKSLSTPTPSFRRRKTIKSTAYWKRKLYESFYFVLHHLLSTGFSDTSWLGLILSQQAHHIPHCQRKFHFSPSLMGDYCNVKPWDLNNTSGFYYEKKGLYFGVFLFQRSPDTKPWITWNNGLQWSALCQFLEGKRLLYLPNDQNSVIQLSLRNSPRFSKLSLVRKPGGGRRPGWPWNGPDFFTTPSSPRLQGPPCPQGPGSHSQALSAKHPRSSLGRTSVEALGSQEDHLPQQTQKGSNENQREKT